jgi:hypothetical protein
MQCRECGRETSFAIQIRKRLVYVCPDCHCPPRVARALEEYIVRIDEERKKKNAKKKIKKILKQRKKIRRTRRSSR